LEEIDDGVWAIYYGPVFLGWLDEDDYRIMDVRNTSETLRLPNCNPSTRDVL